MFANQLANRRYFALVSLGGHQSAVWRSRKSGRLPQCLSRIDQWLPSPNRIKVHVRTANALLADAMCRYPPTTPRGFLGGFQSSKALCRSLPMSWSIPGSMRDFGPCPSTVRRDLPLLVVLQPCKQQRCNLGQPPRPNSEPLQSLPGQRHSPWKGFAPLAFWGATEHNERGPFTAVFNVRELVSTFCSEFVAASSPPPFRCIPWPAARPIQ